MSFLSSPQVRAGLVEINELQEDIYKDAMKFPPCHRKISMNIFLS